MCVKHTRSITFAESKNNTKRLFLATSQAHDSALNHQPQMIRRSVRTQIKKTCTAQQAHVAYHALDFCSPLNTLKANTHKDDHMGHTQPADLANH